MKILLYSIVVVLLIVFITNMSDAYSEPSSNISSQQNTITSNNTDAWFLHWNHHNDILNYNELTHDLSNHGYAIVPGNTTEWFLWWKNYGDILNYSDIVFTGDIISKKILNVTSFYTAGNIKSTIVGSMEQGTYYITGPPYKKINYTLNLDQYTVNIDKFLKNSQSSNKIIIRESIIDPNWHSDPVGPRFNVGDHVLFYVKSFDGYDNAYSQLSFKIPNTCNGTSVLTQNPYAGSDFTMTQNDIQVDYNKSVQNINNFTANKPIQFVYQEPTNTLSGKDSLIKIEIFNNDHYNGLVLSKVIDFSSKKCEWMQFAKWELSLKSGNYFSNISVKNDDGTYGTRYSAGFSVNPYTINTSLHDPNFEQIPKSKTPEFPFTIPILLISMISLIVFYRLQFRLN
jgi:hypothetical protein